MRNYRPNKAIPRNTTEGHGKLRNLTEAVNLAKPPWNPPHFGGRIPNSLIFLARSTPFPTPRWGNGARHPSPTPNWGRRGDTKLPTWRLPTKPRAGALPGNNVREILHNAGDGQSISTSPLAYRSGRRPNKPYMDGSIPAGRILPLYDSLCVVIARCRPAASARPGRIISRGGIMPCFTADHGISAVH